MTHIMIYQVESKIIFSLLNYVMIYNTLKNPINNYIHIHIHAYKNQYIIILYSSILHSYTNMK